MKHTITTDELRQTGARAQRWLSIPDSRLVLNPLRFEGTSSELTHAMTSDRNTMPLNLGFLDPTVKNGTGRWLTDLLTFYESPRGERSVRTLWNADNSLWSRDQAIDLTCAENVSIAVRNEAPVPWQYTSQRLVFDLSDRPVLSVNIAKTTGHWALKLCRDGCADAVVQGDCSSSGVFTYVLDKPFYYDENGHFSGEIKFFSIGYGATAVFGNMSLFSLQNSPSPASAYGGVTWHPHKLTAEADYPMGLSLSFTDTFAESETVLRTIETESDGRLLVLVQLCGDVLSSDDRSILMKLGNYACAVSWSESAALKFYANRITALGDDCGKDSAEGCTAAVIDFGTVKAWEKLTFAVTITSDPDTAKVKSQQYASPEKARDAEEKLAQYWNDYLKKVPHPERFAIEAVDAKGISPEYIRQMYYIGWIFMAQNVLPPNPELGFPYRQIACGKPSMWAYGDEKAVYTASWESFFGMMALGYVMPDTAWDAYLGLMSLVDDEGILAGESLPSEKAHTAILLYRITKDRDKLASAYENIARYLRWRVENPRWIYLEHNNPDAADADFAESALLDIAYMKEIAEVLGKDTAEWEAMYADFLEKYKFWFFEDKKAYQYTSRSKLTKSPGNTIWVTKGLCIDGLEAEYTDILYSRFLEEYDPEKSFCGFKMSKFPDNSHTIYGLFRHGYTDEARILNEACMRDVLRVGMFSEGYSIDDIPLPEGVRPSIFGCMMLLDGVLLTNGFRMTENTSHAY